MPEDAGNPDQSIAPPETASGSSAETAPPAPQGFLARYEFAIMLASMLGIALFYALLAAQMEWFSYLLESRQRGAVRHDPQLE